MLITSWLTNAVSYGRLDRAHPQPMATVTNTGATTEAKWEISAPALAVVVNLPGPDNTKWTHPAEIFLQQGRALLFVVHSVSLNVSRRGGLA